ncbi:DUF4190 domain-containing protein [Clostridium arbusti]|uniref:DUF4190 domain-containing protein n=1 Tax=Clostridium arbusti TaxID=1137848 RepID=UPI0002899280|nr:DUF4190 domain-containing protein [Clostridium arbusti]
MVKNDNFSVASMILGIISVVFDFIPGINFLGIILAVLAIVFAVIGKNKIKNSNGELNGTGMATAGLVLGIISVALFVLFLAACGALIGAAASSTNY